MYPKIARHLLYPLLDLKRGSKALKYLKELNQSQWYDLKQLRELQAKKLKMLIEHAYNNVTYYHKTFRNLNLKPADIKSDKDLLKLPILTKEIIRKNYADLTAKNFPEDRAYESSTGGSTGEPLQFIQDHQVSNYAHVAGYRFWHWTGWKLGDRHVYLWGAAKDLAREKRVRNKLQRTLLRDNLLPD